MKQIIVFLLFFFCCQSIFSQTLRGDRLIGGTANFGKQFFKERDNSSFLNLNPIYGKFIEDNFAMGGSFRLGFSQYGNSFFTSLGVQPFARLYFGKRDSIRFYADARTGVFLFGRGNLFTDSNIRRNYRFQMGPGVAYFVAENVSLDLSFNYEYSSGAENPDTFQFNFGFQVYLLGKGGGSE